jgi:hypothetical protein
MSGARPLLFLHVFMNWTRSFFTFYGSNNMFSKAQNVTVYWTSGIRSPHLIIIPRVMHGCQPWAPSFPGSYQMCAVFIFIVYTTCLINFILLDLISLTVLKVKSSPCHEGIWEVEECIDPCITKLGTKWKWAVGFILRLYCWGKMSAASTGQGTRWHSGTVWKTCPAENQISSLIFWSIT